jgi:hypothetical protein
MYRISLPLAAIATNIIGNSSANSSSLPVIAIANRLEIERIADGEARRVNGE